MDKDPRKANPPPDNGPFLAATLRELKNAKRRKIYGKQGVASCCPVHEDDTPSLNLWTGEDGWMQVHCFGGCDREDVLAKLYDLGLCPENHPALLRRARDLGKAAGPRDRGTLTPPAPRTTRSPAKKSIELEVGPLILSDETPPPPTKFPLPLKDGEVQSQHGPWVYVTVREKRPAVVVFRLEKAIEKDDGSTKITKRFMQFTPRRIKGEVKWHWCGLNDSDFSPEHPLLMPYGWERAIKNREAPAIFVEGEKACDALLSADPDIVSLSMLGSHPEACALLPVIGGSGRRVVLWPDPDEPGQNKARAIRTAIGRLHGAWVTIMNPAALGLTGKEDAFEWVGRNRQNTLQKLSDVIRTCQFSYYGEWESEPVEGVTYWMRNGAFGVDEEIPDRKLGSRTETRQLGNFVAWVSAARTIVAINGEKSTEFEIKGVVESKRALPPLEVSASIYKMPRRWYGGWGAEGVVLNTGKSADDHLTNAITLYGVGTNKTHRETQNHRTGWISDEHGGWAYLHGAGMLGEQIPNLTCVPGGSPDSGLSAYRLPVTVDVDMARTGLQQSLQLLGLIPGATTALWSSIFLGIFAGSEDLWPPFVLFACGAPGSYKSSLAGAACAHYGNFTHQRLPSNFESTPNAVMMALSAAKDALLVIDDFRTGSDRGEREEKVRVINQITRFIGNHQGRGRLRPDASARPEALPAVMAVVTGEHWPTAIGESGMARMFGIGFTPDSITPQTRERVYGWDYSANRHFMAQMIESVALHRQSWYEAMITRKDYWVKKAGQDLLKTVRHERIRVAAGWLVAGYELGMALIGATAARLPEVYGRITGTAQPGDIEAWASIGERYAGLVADRFGDSLKVPGSLKDACALIYAQAAEYAGVAVETDPSMKLLELLYDLIHTNDVRLLDLEGNDRRQTPFSNRPMIGYYDAEYFYLQPQQMWLQLQNILRLQGSNMMIGDQNAVYERWMGMGVLHGRDGGGQYIRPSEKYFRQLRVESRKRLRLLSLRRAHLDAIFNPQGQGGPPDES